MIAVIVALLAINSWFVYHLTSLDEIMEVRSEANQGKWIGSVAMAEDQTIAATLDNRLLLLQKDKVEKQLQLQESISTIAKTEDQAVIYVGTSSRKIYMYTPALEMMKSFDVPGNVTAISPAELGQIYIAYGIGKYTDRNWVGKYDANGKRDFEAKIGFDISAILPVAEGVYFATADSQVGFIDASGKEVWRILVPQPIIRFDSHNGAVLAGDERGSIYALGEDGSIQWSAAISKYKISTLISLSKTNHILVGDGNGTIYLLDEDRHVYYQSSMLKSEIVEAYEAEHSLISLRTHTGQHVVLSIDAAASMEWRVVVKNMVIGVDAAGIILLYFLWVNLKPERKARYQLLWKRVKRSRVAYGMLLPTFLFIVLFEIVPTLMAFIYSFTNFNLSEPIRFIGFRNFISISQDRFFITGLSNMFLIIVVSILKELTMPLLAAELVFWIKHSRVKYWFRTGFVLVSIVPGIVVTLLWKMMYDPDNGLINAFLKLIHLEHFQRAWLGEDGLAIWSIMLAGFPYVQVFAFLIYFGGLITINQDIFDSAQMDGVTVWKRFTSIDLPMIMPQIKLLIFFTLIGSIQGYASIFIYTKGGPGISTYVPGLQMYFQISDGQYGYASAIGFVLAVFVLIFTYLNNRFMKREEV
jgi:ABC-type sugar transport system permease subunit/outer membrane protein assembly factor BamB